MPKDQSGVKLVQLVCEHRVRIQCLAEIGIKMEEIMLLIGLVIPLGLKIIYTLFVCALAPIYWRKYGPANFLWFSDIALLVLVPAL